jgi:hypothetical protein
MGPPVTSGLRIRSKPPRSIRLAQVCKTGVIAMGDSQWSFMEACACAGSPGAGRATHPGRTFLSPARHLHLLSIAHTSSPGPHHSA